MQQHPIYIQHGITISTPASDITVQAKDISSGDKNIQTLVYKSKMAAMFSQHLR